MNTFDLVEKSKERYAGLVDKLPVKPKNVEYGICEVRIDLGSKNLLCLEDTGRVAVYNKGMLVQERYCYFEDEYQDALTAVCV